MGDVTKGEGRTILFVSHNLAAVNTLCNKGIVLEQGKLIYDGMINGAMDSYLSSGNTSSNLYISDTNQKHSIQKIEVLDNIGQNKSDFKSDEEVNIKFTINTNHDTAEKSSMAIKVMDQKERVVFSNQINLMNLNFNNLETLTCKIPKNVLVPNNYKVTVAFRIPNGKIFSYLEEIVDFNIIETGSELHQYDGADYGCVFINCHWSAK